ncbi:disulfide oxidoreductase [Bacillus paranthracis]
MGREKKQEYALFTAWGASFIATLGSLYFSEIMKFEPCVLCWYQRIFMYPFVLWLGIAVVKKTIASQIILYQSQVLVLVFLYITMQFKKIAAFSAAGAACGRVPCTGEYINWFGFVTIPFLALIGFITIAVCSFIVIKNK